MGLDRGRMWKKTTTVGAAWNFCRKCINTVGVEFGLPVLSKKMPIPLIGEMSAPPNGGVRRRP